MDIPVRTHDQSYFPNGHTEPLRVKFTREKGYHLDWNIELRWYHTSAHDLQKRIATRTDCVSFTDFMFLFKKSFAFLIRTLREVPPPHQGFNVVFANRRLRYAVYFTEEVDGTQRFLVKTILDRYWDNNPQERYISIPF